MSRNVSGNRGCKHLDIFTSPKTKRPVHTGLFVLGEVKPYHRLPAVCSLRYWLYPTSVCWLGAVHNVFPNMTVIPL